MALDEPETNEKAVPVNGLEVLIDEDVRSFTEGKVVDYISSPYGETFTVENPYEPC